MQRIRPIFSSAAKMLSLQAAIAAALLLAPAGAVFAGQTALDRYVAKPDSSYSWKIVAKTRLGDATRFVVDLKSQTWRSKKEVNRPLWQHCLTIVRPDKPISNIPYLFITGGSNGD